MNRLAEHLKDEKFRLKVKNYQKELRMKICADIPNAFWERKKHSVSLTYIEGFDEKFIPTKARVIQMNERYLKLCQQEIVDLLEKGLIRKSFSAWSCPVFYVENAAELERGVPRLVINYKSLNNVLK